MTMPGSPRGGLSRSQVDAAVAAAVGLAQLGVVEPVLCHGGQATGGQTLTALSAYLQLVRVARPVTVASLTCYTSAATTSLHLGIMDATFTRVAAAAAKVLAVAGGLNTQALTAAFTYQPGVDYYHVIVCDTTVAVVRGYAAVAATVLNVGVGAGTQRALIKAVAQDTVPASLVTPTASPFGLWIAGHN